jgi:hypothetical protein
MEEVDIRIRFPGFLEHPGIVINGGDIEPDQTEKIGFFAVATADIEEPAGEIAGSGNGASNRKVSFCGKESSDIRDYRIKKSVVVVPEPDFGNL